MNNIITNINDYLKENVDNKKISDKLAIWFMNFYSSQVINFINKEDIPNHLFKESKKHIIKESNKLYRCESRNIEITKAITFSPKNNAGISWTTDKDMALGFLEPEFEGYSYLYELDINDIKYPISMDLIMDIITEEQRKMITNHITKEFMKDYSTEKEVLVFDTFKSNILNIKEIK